MITTYLKLYLKYNIKSNMKVKFNEVEQSEICLVYRLKLQCFQSTNKKTLGLPCMYLQYMCTFKYSLYKNESKIQYNILTYRLSYIKYWVLNQQL